MQYLEVPTERLVLRQWREADLAPFALLNADPEVMAYFPDTLDSQQSDAMARRCASLIEQRGWGLWAVEERLSHRFIGFVGLHIPAHDLPFQPCVEIGWRLARTYWGQGYAFEAAQAALRIGFEELGLEEIVAFATAENRRSIALMERLSMRQDIAGSFDHPAVADIPRLRPHVLYRLRLHRWRQAQGAPAIPQPA
ncbi:GNAT family N-acetyltransferase [Methylobacillus sp.]|uniref:GNAT family N-acetyltransferase n=1 Tax=Methylobacillus sp. TaxID=56818 RepID=UPI0012C6CB34|nr:GNAT family N-acetyltransferase [Methylobacillus sp.]MPS48580.1 N-acetyltransferase [Methylobacillus sp.]